MQSWDFQQIIFRFICDWSKKVVYGLSFTVKDRMMIKTECQLKMAKKYKKVFHFYPSFNDTFFFIGQKDARQDCAVHVNIKGQILL